MHNPLTIREAQVMALVCTGLSSRHIAAELGLHRSHIDKARASSIFKLGAKNVAHAAVIFDRMARQSIEVKEG